MKAIRNKSRGLLSLHSAALLACVLCPFSSNAALVLMIEPSVAAEGVNPTNAGVQAGSYAQNETYTSPQTGGLKFNAKIWIKDDQTNMPVAIGSLVSLTANLTKGANSFNINYGGGIYPGTQPSYQIYDASNGEVNYPGPVTGTAYTNDDGFSFTLAYQFVPFPFDSGNYSLAVQGDQVGYTVNATAQDTNGNTLSGLATSTATLVPEPSSAGFMITALGALLCRRPNRRPIGV